MLKPGDHIHFMGICGTAMASLAGIMKQKGFHVTGSDQNVYPPMSTQVESLGIKIMQGYRPEHVLEKKPDLVVIGNVISRGNPEAEAVLQNHISYISLPKALGELVIEDRDSIVISGTHGKTTTTSMMAWVSSHIEKGVGFLIGGIPKNFNQSFQAPQGKYFVIEGDEYDTAFFDKVPKFIHYRPKYSILTSLEFDHADIYKDLEDVRSAFRRLFPLLPADGLLLYCADDPNVAELVHEFKGNKMSYGILSGDSRAKDIVAQKDWTEFEAVLKGESLGSYQIQGFGKHNILNALAVITLAHHLKWDRAIVQKALASFQGVKRRQEILGTPGGVRVIEDFAHHPTAVALTVASVRDKFPEGRVFAVFEPRSATSRRKIFQKEYGEAFKQAQFTFIARPFDQSKINEADRFSTDDLVADIKAQGQQAWACDGADEIVAQIKSLAKPQDTVLIMSNGGFDNIYGKMMKALE